MALTDPRSIIREILSRRPDLHAAFAPQLSAAGIQVAGPGFSGETRRRADANAALQAGTVPPTTLGPVPTNMGGFPPRATTESANMEFGRERERALMRSPFGDQEPLGQRNDIGPPTPPIPGSLDYGREAERARMRSPFGPQEPLGREDIPPPGGPPPPGLAARGPMPPSFGAGPGRDMARLPQFRPSFAPGTAEASLPPPLPQARPSISPGPVPPNMGSFPPRPAAGAGLASDTGGIPPQIAALMGPSGIAPSMPPTGAPFSPYGPNASPARMPQYRPPNIPQARPPQGMSIEASPPEGPGPAPGPPPPLSPDQRIANSSLDVAREAVRQQAAARATQPPLGAPGQPRLLGAGTSLDLAGAGPKPPLGSTVLSPDTLDPSAQFASVGQRIAPYTGTGTGMTARLPRPRPDFSPQLGDVPPAGTAPLGAVTGQDLPAPGQSSSLTPQQIQRTMGSQALYGQLPPGMGDIPFPGAPPTPAPVKPQAPFWNAPNTGTAVGALLGLGAGGLGGALAGAGLGRLAGKGVKFINNRLPDAPPIDASGVPAITPPPPPPPQQQSMPGGIFGTAKSGMRALRGLPKDLAAMVRDGRLPLAEAQRMISGSGSAGSSVSGGNWSGGSRTGGGGGSGWGGWGGGGNYGGGYGRNLTEGVGGAYRNR